jgi:hypothetical protein
LALDAVDCRFAFAINVGQFCAPIDQHLDNFHLEVCCRGSAAGARRANGKMEWR